MTALDYGLLSGTVLPVFVAREEATDGFCGSGVLLGCGIFLTCWHCVSHLPEGARHVVGVPIGDGHECRTVDLEQVGRDANGTDLAIGVVDAQPTVELRLADHSYSLLGHDVWSFGYPYTEQTPATSGGYDFALNGRLLRGYVTRTFMHEPVNGNPVEAYEVDMPVPRGMSGSPLVLRGGHEVAGLVFGANDVETIDENLGTNPRSRIVSFGLALSAGTIRAASAQATAGRTLADYLSS